MKTLLRTALFATALAAAPAFAEVNVDEYGFGFIGKGDVQLAFDWNDAALQANADALSFSMRGNSTTTTWDCIHTNPAGHVVRNPRNNTTSTSGLLLHEARRNPQNRVTGFFALGFDPEASSGTVSTGHALGSCPSGNNSVVDPASVVVIVNADGTGLSVSADGGTTWISL
jgi:hypothetical protein